VLSFGAFRSWWQLRPHPCHLPCSFPPPRFDLRRLGMDPPRFDVGWKPPFLRPAWSSTFVFLLFFWKFLLWSHLRGKSLAQLLGGESPFCAIAYIPDFETVTGNPFYHHEEKSACRPTYLPWGLFFPLSLQTTFSCGVRMVDVDRSVRSSEKFLRCPTPRSLHLGLVHCVNFLDR